MALQDAIDQIVTTVKAVANVRYVPNYPPDQLPSGVSVIPFPSTGVFSFNTPEDLRGVHEVQVLVLVPHRDTARDLKTLSPMIDAIPLALMSQLRTDQLGGTVDLFSAVRYEQAPELLVNDIKYIGYQFTIEGLKIRANLT